MQLLKLLTPVFIAIFLILSDYKFSYLDSVKQSIAQLISPIYSVANLPSQLYVWIGEQGATKQILLNKNKQLTAELTRLKAHLQTHNAALLENKKLKQLLGVSYQINGQKFILGRVSSIGQSRLKKQIIINKGGNDGLVIGQVVLGSRGVVGQITQITPLYAAVLMITDPTQYVPIKNQRNDIRGISRGIASNRGKLVVNFIESDLDVLLGDIFVTSAVGSKFPDGYPVGKVTHIEQHTDDPFLHIELAPLQTIEQLEFVLIKEND